MQIQKGNIMYRQYEDPRKLEEELEELKAHGEELYLLAEQEGELSGKWEEWADIGQEIEELKERINFAWQDEEYDEMNKDPADEEWVEENCDMEIE